VPYLQKGHRLFLRSRSLAAIQSMISIAGTAAANGSLEFRSREHVSLVSSRTPAQLQSFRRLGCPPRRSKASPRQSVQSSDSVPVGAMTEMRTLSILLNRRQDQV
jgi:hypothetical protein